MAQPIAALLAEARAKLEAAGIPQAATDAELLLAHVLGKSRGELKLAQLSGDSLSDFELLERYRALLDRRADNREPLQHLTGVAYFRYLELAVGPGVFVPRPETESLVELGLAFLRTQPARGGERPLVFDLGTGSGAIALSIAGEFPEARVVAIEKTPEAHRWAEQNMRALNPEGVQLLLGDYLEPLTDLDVHRSAVSLVLANPPYIPESAVPRDPEVHRYDPAEALYGGVDGLDLVRVISQRSRDWLHQGGQLIMEHGEAQGEAIRAILLDDGYQAVQTLPDLTRRDRFTSGIR